MPKASIDESDIKDPQLLEMITEFNRVTRVDKDLKKASRRASARLKILNQAITERLLETEVSSVSLGKDGCIRLISSVKLDDFEDL